MFAFLFLNCRMLSTSHLRVVASKDAEVQGGDEGHASPPLPCFSPCSVASAAVQVVALPLWRCGGTFKKKNDGGALLRHRRHFFGSYLCKKKFLFTNNAAELPAPARGCGGRRSQKMTADGAFPSLTVPARHRGGRLVGSERARTSNSIERHGSCGSIEIR